MTVLRKKNPALQLLFFTSKFNLQLPSRALEVVLGGVDTFSYKIKAGDTHTLEKFLSPQMDVLDLHGKAGMLQGWPWLSNQGGFLYKSCTSIKTYLRNDKILPRVRKRNIEETILLTLRAE